VITTDDSGGVLEFVEDGKTGLVTAAAAQAVYRRVMGDSGEAERMECCGQRKYRTLPGIW